MTNSDPLELRINDSDLPTAIKKHLIRCIREGKPHRWHHALEEDFDRVVTETNTVVDTACRNTRRDRESLLQHTDFHSNDLDPDRLDAAISELRGLNQLQIWGFKNIRLLRAKPGTRTADLVAERNGQSYAFEIACSSGRPLRELDVLPKYMLEVCRLKEEQLNNSKKSHGCRYRALVFVINSKPAVYIGYQRSYLQIARQVYQQLGSPDDYFVAVVTGQYAQVMGGQDDAFEGPDDVVYPVWPHNA